MKGSTSATALCLIGAVALCGATRGSRTTGNIGEAVPPRGLLPARLVWRRGLRGCRCISRGTAASTRARCNSRRAGQATGCF